MTWVTGCRRVPDPPARTMPFGVATHRRKDSTEGTRAARPPTFSRSLETLCRPVGSAGALGPGDRGDGAFCGGGGSSQVKGHRSQASVSPPGTGTGTGTGSDGNTWRCLCVVMIGGDNVDFHCVVNSARSVLAAGAAGVGALPDRVAAAAAFPPRWHHGRRGLQVLAFGLAASGTRPSRPVGRLTAPGLELRAES